jgi:hypothetical protein
MTMKQPFLLKLRPAASRRGAAQTGGRASAGRRRCRLAALAVLAGGLWVLAGPSSPTTVADDAGGPAGTPTTVPVAPAAGRPGGPGMRPGDGGTPGGTPGAWPTGRPPRWLDAPPPGPWGPPGPATAPAEDVAFSADEKAQFEAFMEANSLKKWKTFRLLPPDGRRTRQVRNGLASRYRALQQTKAVDPVRFESEVAVIRIEDDVYGILQELRAGLGVTENEARLRDRAAALLDVRHNWRLERLRRVRQELADMKLGDAAGLVGREIGREEAGGGATAGRKNREEQIDQLVARFKQAAKGVPRLNRPLPGGDRPAASEGQPAAEGLAPSDGSGSPPAAR